jgi:hypothetical protein
MGQCFAEVFLWSRVLSHYCFVFFKRSMYIYFGNRIKLPRAASVVNVDLIVDLGY